MMNPRRPQLTVVKPVAFQAGHVAADGIKGRFVRVVASVKHAIGRGMSAVASGASAARSVGWSGIKGTARVIRYCIYYLMLWLRILVSWLSNVCAGVGLLALLLAWLFKPGDYMWQIAGFSFGAFMVGWLYDTLLLLVAPEPIYLDGRMPNND